MDISARAMLWLSSRDTGSSSKAILTHMMGGVSDSSYPLDPSDLGRCLRLLDLIPEWKPRMSEMAKYGGAWIALSERWADLEATMKRECGPELRDGKCEGTCAMLRVLEADGFRRDPDYECEFDSKGRLTGWTNLKANRCRIDLWPGMSVEMPA